MNPDDLRALWSAVTLDDACDILAAMTIDKPKAHALAARIIADLDALSLLDPRALEAFAVVSVDMRALYPGAQRQDPTTPPDPGEGAPPAVE